MAADNPPVRITSADLRYSPDARAGRATVTVTPSPVDTTEALVSITYADGARENAGMLNMIAMGGPPGWRMEIGTVTGPSGPPLATASPAP